MDLTWTFSGTLTSLCMVSLAVAIVWLIIENWTLHRTTTKFFCLGYTAYLCWGAFIVCSEPDTTVNIIKTAIDVVILCPIIVCLTRLLRLGDLFQMGLLVRQLREQVRRLKVAPSSETSRLSIINDRLETTLEQLDKIIRKNKLPQTFIMS